ncbi:methyltransferase domain-containing protein [Rubrivirga marina]|uniref:methyltransferase domain-containing protein n=1 Tax=Rubrivirga marina TaxID=1196024 RepID=UPI00117BBA0F|nr:class I SAM-dependent methyltransferase [Rubrivirga marina]
MTLDALTPLLRCPACGAALSLDRVPQPDPEAGDCGVLRCPCAADYPVLDGVPILRTGRLDRRSIADDLVLAPGPDVAAVVSAVEAGRALGALVDLLAAPLCPWPLNRVGAGRRLSLLGPLRSAGLALRRRRVHAMLRHRDGLTAEDWLATFYLHAPEVYDPFNYFFFRFGTPRHLATLGLVSALPADASPVLDLACGYGHLAHTLSALGRAVVGLDQNVHQAWLARHYVAPGAAFVCADASRPLPFADAAFGAAVCSDAFHYVRDKGGAVAELDRVSAGGPLLFPTVGNALVGSPDGHELAPDAYRALFDGWHVRVTSDDAVFAHYREGLGPDLSGPDADVDGAKWLAIAATKGDPDCLLRDHGPLDAGPGGWPHAAGRLALNPLYEREPGGDRRALRMPSPWYEAENGGVREYMPAVVGEGEALTTALVARAAAVGLPERYARPRRPWTQRADRALTRAVRRVRG